MLLSYIELVELVEAGVIDANLENINGASIDVTLGDTILVEKVQYGSPVIDLSKKQSPEMVSLIIDPSGYIMQPGQFILASTQETFNLPNDIAAEFKLKSSIARGGLNHLLAGYADPRWHNSKLTLELKNELSHHQILLKTGMKIGQIIFYRVTPVPEEHSYAVKGRYNNTTEVTASKGV
jgi:dCTP deaminase